MLVRHILDEGSWPPDQTVDDLEGLLSLFGCGDLGDLEDHLHGLLPEDPGDVTIDNDGGSVSIHTAGVAMWSMPYPVSGNDFDSYLFELDERMTLQKSLWELPDADSWADDGRPSIVPLLAQLLRATPEEFSTKLGDNWYPLDLDWVGSGSNPTNYLWTGRSVVALDNANAYLYRRTTREGPFGFELDGEAYEEVRWVDEIWRDGGPSLDWFTILVMHEDGSGARGTCPSCGSGEVMHIVFGLPADPDALPSWKRLGGCVVDDEIADRHCESCGLEWTADGLDLEI
jgi:hypothetical protein